MWRSEMVEVVRRQVADIKFGVDAFRPERIEGWIRSLGTDMPITLSLIVNGESVGSFHADNFRADLTRMRSDGKFSFLVTPFGDDWRKSIARAACVKIRVASSG